MDDNAFQMRWSWWFWAVLYDILALLFFWLPKTVRTLFVKPLKDILEDAIITAYLMDGSDIGFFESFILGADKTREMVEDVYKILKVHHTANLKERMCTPLPENLLHSEKQDILCSFVQEKKRLVVALLKNRNQIILYLHKRLAVRRPILYFLLWFPYRVLGRGL